MKLNEGLIEQLKQILKENEEKVLATRHGSELTTKTYIEFMDRDFNETPTFVEGKSVGLFASLSVYVAGKESEEDPCYGYSMIFDFEEKNAEPEAVLERERAEFESEINRFVEALEETDDAADLIYRESEEADKEAKEALTQLEDTLKKTKKYTVIGFAVIIALFIALIIIKGLT